MKLLITIILLSFSAQMYSQQMVYKPRNPNFGGDTFNYNWLLSSAEAQNTLDDSKKTDNTKSDLEKFTESLNNQLLNAVSRSLFADQFGNGDLEPGTYTFGSLAVEISPSSEGLVISILDTGNGEQTQIIIPN